MSKKENKRIKDTSYILEHGYESGDIVTPGVLEEVKRNDPNLYLKFFELFSKGMVELFSIPGTLTWYLIKLTLISKSDEKLSSTDLEVCTAGVITGYHVKSKDRDINSTLLRYYLGLGLRASISFVEYYALNLLSDGRLAEYAQNILNQISKYIK